MLAVNISHILQLQVAEVKFLVSVLSDQGLPAFLHPVPTCREEALFQVQQGWNTAVQSPWPQLVCRKKTPSWERQTKKIRDPPYPACQAPGRVAQRFCPEKEEVRKNIELWNSPRKTDYLNQAVNKFKTQCALIYIQRFWWKHLRGSW